MVISIMQSYRDTLLPLLPWAIARRESGEAAASDCDIQFDMEPRISHYCVQVLANLACDDVPEPASAIPTFKVATSLHVCYFMAACRFLFWPPAAPSTLLLELS
jgi:hypothetical protein